ncbi:MAG: SDR family oxidoreductase [Bacteroidales bacterium]|nr:SDR family oxidoreductase [Bacteroidales bacterium]
MNFKGRTVWITGASSGIGEALAWELGRLGSDLVLSSRNTEKLNRLAKAISEKYQINTDVIFLDLGNNATIPEAIEQFSDRHQKIDILVNNAGISQRSLLIETPVEVDRQVFEVNFFGTITLTKGLLPMMIKAGGGHIVVMSSVVGKFGISLRSAYSASKHALHGFFETLRCELSDKNIKVTIICPGRIRTSISVNAVTKDGSNYGRMDEGQAKGVSPEKFARRVVKAIHRNRKEVATGGKEILMIYIRRFLPWLYYILASRVKPT